MGNHPVQLKAYFALHNFFKQENCFRIIAPYDTQTILLSRSACINLNCNQRSIYIFTAYSFILKFHNLFLSINVPYFSLLVLYLVIRGYAWLPKYYRIRADSKFQTIFTQFLDSCKFCV